MTFDPKISIEKVNQIFPEDGTRCMDDIYAGEECLKIPEESRMIELLKLNEELGDSVINMYKNLIDIAKTGKISQFSIHAHSREKLEEYLLRFIELSK